MEHDALVAQERDVKRLQDAYALLSTNRQRALVELEELANGGSVLSMLYLAQTYASEPGADHARAEKWYRAAYERGSSTALFALGSKYFREGKYEEAEQIFSDGVSKNDGVSMYWLASLYIVDPRNRGEPDRIRDLVERSAALGQVRAKRDLASFLMKGRYGKREIARGLYLSFSSVIEAFLVGYRDPASRKLW